MGNKQAASIGKLPEKPGFYWYIPGPLPPTTRHARPTARPQCICELRHGEMELRFTDGSRQSWVHEQDQFFGPLQPPNQQWTVYWLDGRKSLIEGESIEAAFRDAGYGGGAIGAVDLWAKGDDHEYAWDGTKRQWSRLTEKAES